MGLALSPLSRIFPIWNWRRPQQTLRYDLIECNAPRAFAFIIMKNRDIPPIASPFGSGTPASQSPFVEVANADAIRIYERRSASVGILLRVNIKGMFCAPHLILLFIGFLPFMVILIVHTLVTELERLRGKVPVITLERAGARFISKSEEKFAPWSDVTHIVERGGDVFILAHPLARNIAREDFNSLEEAREFAQLARELKQSNGAAWRDEWNGRVFGA